MIDFYSFYWFKFKKVEKLSTDNKMIYKILIAERCNFYLFKQD